MAKDEAPAGAPMWMVTFADLMSLLVCFFVLIISFSVPDTEKIQVVAGSMSDAFGFTKEVVVTGMIEIEGNPRYRYARDVLPMPLDNVVGQIDEDGIEVPNQASGSSEWQEIDEEILEELTDDGEDEGFKRVPSKPLTEEERFDEIEKELLEAIEKYPELNDLGDNLAIERVPEGLKIQMIDQARQSMFPLGSAQMYVRAKNLLSAVVASISKMPNKVWITGHTDALVFKRTDGYDNWSLSVDRANETRKMLVAAGLDPARIASVIGKGDTEHMVPERPKDPRNRRISITLLREQPLSPVPAPETQDLSSLLRPIAPR